MSLIVLRSAPTTRDPSAWPFLANSIWNQPIGDGAVYSPFHATSDANGGEQAVSGISKMGLRLTNGLPAGLTPNNFGIDPNFIVFAQPGDPVRNVYYTSSWGPGRANGTTLIPKYPGGPTPYQIQIPDSLVIPDATSTSTPNSSTAIVQPDGSIHHFNVACRPVAGQDNFHGIPLSSFLPSWVGTHAKIDADTNLYGSGYYGGHGGSALNTFCSLRPGELLDNGQPIHHALGLNVNGAEYLYVDPWNSVSNAHAGCVWPAPTYDGGAYGGWGQGYYGHYKFLRMGSLLAIPPDVNLTLTLAPSIKIYNALKNYGAYIVDTTGWTSVDLNATTDAMTEFQAAYGYTIGAGQPGAPWAPKNQVWYDELALIYGALQVVSNNTAATIGGGGTPLVPPAPAFTT
jgi:hypothetical protein